ncbi:hypothetical protein PghCCS26_41640 [Paenibacillus glycanilyticus]|uniref:Uncharacterized protein n=1 Tax=Paenibacillus glycanilyticus TaxID=126569 RepID=A0ABQ6NR47_9BACL|nr:hypothetical protein [Paenibacillus glycanilyticus]GMK47035.1 hypothetical protein PghCCS26_41640 [Paenibacillus glycanilyticus]
MAKLLHVKTSLHETGSVEIEGKMTQNNIGYWDEIGGTDKA